MSSSLEMEKINVYIHFTLIFVQILLILLGI